MAMTLIFDRKSIHHHCLWSYRRGKGDDDEVKASHNSIPEMKLVDFAVSMVEGSW